MRTNGHRSAGTASSGKSTPQSAPTTPFAGIAPDALLTLYNDNYDAALEFMQTAFQAAARMQELELRYGEQALSLAGKAMSTLSATESADMLSVQAGLTQEALRDAASYFEQMVEVSTATSRDFLRVFDKQCRINGLPGGLPLAAMMEQSAAAAREFRAQH